MRKHIILLNICFKLSCLALTGQATNSVSGHEGIPGNDTAIVKWISNLYTFGVSADNDSLIIASEVVNILHDEKLRKLIYPEKYDWSATVSFLEKMELKRAFWFFINLYDDPQNQEMVMRSILKYDTIFEMDIALLSAFYTYSMLDPRVSEISPDGKLVVKRPDLIEGKLRTVKLLIENVLNNRNLRGKE